MTDVRSILQEVLAPPYNKQEEKRMDEQQAALDEEVQAAADEAVEAYKQENEAPRVLDKAFNRWVQKVMTDMIVAQAQSAPAPEGAAE